jgi:hypothetical protein
MMSRPRNFVVACAILAALLGLVACGGSKPASNKAIDACALLTKADAEKILGQPVKDAEHPIEGSETFLVTSCSYHVQGGTAMDRAVLIATIPQTPDATTAQTAFDTGKKGAQANYNAAPVDVPGLGDAAYWVGGAGNNLFILQGEANLTLSASSQQGDAPSPAIVELGKVVLGRLP